MRRLCASPCAVALAIVLGLLVLAGCGGGDTTTVVETVTERGETSGSGTSASGTAGEGDTELGETAGGGEATAPAESEAPAEFLALESFQSPSGNIGCVSIGGNARCDAVKHSWAAPRPADCPPSSDAGQGLEVGAAGEAGVVCAGDTALDSSAPVLEYGTASEVGGTVCVSRRMGVTCTNPDGHGFTISAETYELF